MQYLAYYDSPIADIMITADEIGLTGIRFEGQSGFISRSDSDKRCHNEHIILEAKEWLSIYFSGREPNFMPPIHFIGSDFQKSTWELLLKIPYGKTVTYGELAAKLALDRGIARMSAQAVGGAAGKNPVSVIVPCHRVVGARGALTGYNGGIDKKIALLNLEGVDVSRFLVR